MAMNPIQRVTLIAELRKKTEEAAAAAPLAKIGIARRIADIVAMLEGEKSVPKVLAGSAPEALPQTAEAWVSDQRLATMQAAIKSFQRRAAKLGVDPVVLEVLESRKVRVLLSMDSKAVHGKTAPLDAEIPMGWRGAGITRQTRVRITGDLPQLSGWRFVAALDHKGKGNVVRAVPGGGEVPARFLTAASVCEHCGTTRNRNKTLVVVNGAGEYKQVGSNCLKDFLGHGDAEALAALAEWRSSFWSSVIREGDDEDYEGFASGGRSRNWIETEVYLRYVATAVREDGWVSRAAADGSGRLTTAELAVQSYSPVRGETPQLKPTDADRETATKALAWARGLTDAETTANSFLHNLRVLAGEDAVSYRDIGMTAAIIIGYQKATQQARERERMSKGESTWQGEVAKRGTFAGLTLMKVVKSEGAYGITSIHRFLDAAGNVFVWYASGEALDEGKTYDVTATVKKHDDYKGVKQTVITRAKAVEVADGNAAKLDSALSAIMDAATIPRTWRTEEPASC